MLAIMLVLGGGIAGWWQWQNYRGAQLWANTKRDLEARGESLDLATFIPPAIPDEQNLAFAPLFIRLYQYKVDRRTGLLTFNPDRDEDSDIARTVEALPYGVDRDSSALPPAWQNWTTAHALDLATPQRYYLARPAFPHAPAAQAPADAVLLVLTRFAPLLDELARAAARRPQTRFPINWSRPAAMALPHYNFMQSTVEALRLRACASLRLGRTEEAMRDITLGLRLDRAVAGENLISSLVEYACIKHLLQPTWEGLADRRWSAAELAQLQKMLSGIDLLQTFQHAVREDRVLSLTYLRMETHDPGVVRGSLEKVRDELPATPLNKWIFDQVEWTATLVSHVPQGLCDEAMAVFCRLDQQYLIEQIDVKARRVSARAIGTGQKVVEGLSDPLSDATIKLTYPVLISAAIKAARMQAAIDEATTACALERFYVDHQAYPGRLDVLLPAYLNHVPTGPIDGAPLRYRLTSDGRYRLWEVGWNGQDEDGKIAWNKSDQPRVNDAQGDWVWQYEAVQPP